MKILSYNVNGIRAAMNKGLGEYLKNSGADIVCLQEIKANENQIDKIQLAQMGFEFQYYFPAEKPGYSGVAILSRHLPNEVIMGCNHHEYDREGRVVTAFFNGLSVTSLYIPSGSSGEERQSFKMKTLPHVTEYFSNLRKKEKTTVICGDFNICREARDIHDPKGNEKSSGFLPEERDWFNSFLESGWVDTFRLFNEDSGNYSWWTYRANARVKNKGWRIDYFIINSGQESIVSEAWIDPSAVHSDHCPVGISLL